jgi:hypothetical protein
MRFALCALLGVMLVSCASRPAGPVTNPSQAAATQAPAMAAPAPAGRVVSAAELVDHTGDSIETAVGVPVDVPNEGVDFQNNWIYDHFGRFRRKSFGMGHAPGSSGHERHYDVITFELPDNSVHTVYFDMTEFWEHAGHP